MIEHQAALEARETATLAAAVASPYLKREDRRRFLRRLDGLARILRPRAPEPPAPTEYDPVKAAAWFAAHGYEVVSDG